jgi:hypothetical protein
MTNLLIAFLLLSPFLVPILTWLLLIRPYCRRHGQGYTPGATWGTTIWVDCQQANEIATRLGDRKMQWACRAFIAWLILVAFFWVLMLVIST